MKQTLIFLRYLLLAACLHFALGGVANADGLAGSEWRPTRTGSSALPPQAEQFVQFKGDAKLAGHGGCNRFFGQYKVSGNEISIGPVGSTRMACPEPVMDAEMAFFAALDSARTYRRDKANLVLFGTDDKETARLVQTDRD